ncbi:acyl carrier protein [Luteibacter pinisoli]|uniref:acyl carrier protein n=1 Tax=Luteibacter pinisoli TaxID=2589080 RepID=UPI001B863D30|nr:acyl carrier protein [Luteibacter pinisoli]
MNVTDTTLARLIEIVTPFGQGRVPVIDASTELTGDLELDSLRVMDLMLAVEDEFDISVPINSLGEVRTVGDLASLIQKSVDASA